MSGVWEFFADIGWSGALDIAVMTLLIYSVLIWLKRTRRATLALIGIVIVAFIYLGAHQLGLELTAAVLQAFFAIFLVALVVIFQEELRSFFEQIATWSFQRRVPLKKDRVPPSRREVSILSRTLPELASRRIGALVVITGREPLTRHLDGGERLGGRLSAGLLESIFDPSSPGHDGAVVLEADLVQSFGVRLPLSRESGASLMGTRHTAARGLSEVADALCLVVSEERGTISVARNGNLTVLDNPNDVGRVLEEYLDEVAPVEDPGLAESAGRNLREKGVAALLAFALWFVLVHEDQRAYRTLTVPVRHGTAAPERLVTRITPEEVKVTISAPRRRIYFTRDDEIRVTLKDYELERGWRRLTLSRSHISLPNGIAFEKVEPSSVTVQVESAPPSDAGKSPGS